MVVLFCRNSVKKEQRLRFYSCYAAVRRVVHSHNIEPVARHSRTMFCALSFYFDRALDTKMIGCFDIFFVIRCVAYNESDS